MVKDKKRHTFIKAGNDQKSINGQAKVKLAILAMESLRDIDLF